MTTLIAAAETRAAQAAADLAAAETALVDVMKQLDPAFPPLGAPVAEAVTWRSFEARLECRGCDRPLLEAYSRYRKCQNAERKARAAAHLARMAPASPPVPVAPPARRTRKPKVTNADHVCALRAEEVDARAA